MQNRQHRRRPAPAIMTAVLALAAGALFGCTTYHHITEPTSGRTYLTSNLDEDIRDETGAAVFTDAVTGAEVSLSNSEVVRIGEHEYKELLRDRRSASAEQANGSGS